MESKEKTAKKSYDAQIDSTVETIQTHVEKKSGTGLSSTINTWIDVLEDHKEFKTVASNLKKLKEAIDDKDTKKAVTLLETLGEQTTEAASNAEGKESTKIKQLGKALTSASKAIAKFM